MFPLFESICVLDGHIQNVEYHSNRFLESYQKFYLQFPDFNLLDNIFIPEEYRNGKIKMRISYNQSDRKHSFQPYSAKKVERLKVVVDNSIDYNLKFEDRSALERLYQQKVDCDDILIVRNNAITDTYYANIVFWNKNTWHTPKTCLLKGTKRAQLLETGRIIESSIQLSDLNDFSGFQLINAMLEFDPYTFLPIENIKF